MTASDDDRLAADLARQAGGLLLRLREQGCADHDDLRRRGDRESHEFLMRRLASERPGDAVLSEEGADDLARLSADRVWIIDPLDGTREFGEPGRTDWAVHVALWEKGELTAGAVALPAQDLVLATGGLSTPRQRDAALRCTEERGAAGDERRGKRSAPWRPGGARVTVSRTRPPALAQRVAEATGAELVPLGSAGAKAAEVILGRADAYLHSGGQYEWDSAAPVAVARAAGLHASRIDGSALAYNQDPPSLPDILICRADIAGMLLDAIDSAGAQ